MKALKNILTVVGLIVILLFTWGSALGNLMSGGKIAHTLALTAMGVVWCLFFNLAMKGKS